LSQSGAFSGLGRDHIFCIHEGSDGLLWLGSWGGGLLAFNRDSGTTRYYDKDEGLASNAVYGILEDDQGYLWISSNNGLSRFDPRRAVFTNYGVDDGLQSTEFNVDPILKVQAVNCSSAHQWF
jgi:ligand-binding sensor domain-containing protein